VVVEEELMVIQHLMDQEFQEDLEVELVKTEDMELNQVVQEIVHQLVLRKEILEVHIQEVVLE
jgi:hypothetical protein